jgi:hypothetical protein
MQEKIFFVILNFVSKIHLAPVGEKFDIFYDLQQKNAPKLVRFACMVPFIFGRI